MIGGSNLPIGGFLAAGFWILGAALLSGHVLVFLAFLFPSVLHLSGLTISLQSATGWLKQTPISSGWLSGGGKYGDWNVSNDR